MQGISLTHPMLSSFLCMESVWNIPCCLYFYAGSFSYTYQDGFFFMRRVSLTHPLLSSFLRRLFLRHPVVPSFFLVLFFCFFVLNLFIPCWLHFYLGSFGYTPRAGFNFIRGLSLTDPILASFLSWEFLMHIPSWFYFYAGNFSYTSHAVFIFVHGVCLKHPVLPLFLCGEFLLYIPRWLLFYAGSFSYTSRADFLIKKNLCLTHPVLACFFFFFMWAVSFLCSLLWRQSFKERGGWKLAQEKSVKKSHSNQRRKS